MRFQKKRRLRNKLLIFNLHLLILFLINPCCFRNNPPSMPIFFTKRKKKSYFIFKIKCILENISSVLRRLQTNFLLIYSTTFGDYDNADHDQSDTYHFVHSQGFMKKNNTGKHHYRIYGA